MHRFKIALSGIATACALAATAASANPFSGNYATSYDPSATYAAYGSSDPLFSGSQPYADDGFFRPQAAPTPRQVVEFDPKYGPNRIIISTQDRRLYYTLGNGQAIQYAVGVGRPGFEWAGTMSISRKREWPDWRPPAEMLKRRPDLPRYMSGGPDNPLGARAMYLGSSLYRIHGSNEPETIGQAVSSGCIRMTNEDVEDLYSRVRVGTKVTVLR